MRFPEDDYWPFAGAPIVAKSSFVLCALKPDEVPQKP
jgi:hypothetical protein